MWDSVEKAKRQIGGLALNIVIEVNMNVEWIVLPRRYRFLRIRVSVIQTGSQFDGEGFFGGYFS